MNEIRAGLGVIAGILSLTAFIPYVLFILRGGARPNRASWWIWTACNAGLVISYYASGARCSIWVPLSYALTSLVVAVVSLKWGEGGFSRLDRGCLAASVVGLAVWWLSGSPLTALAVNMGLDLAGAIPTLRKTYRDPRSESLLAWGLFLLANLLNLLAVESWGSFAAALPLQFSILSAVMTALVLRRWLPDRAPRAQ